MLLAAPVAAQGRVVDEGSFSILRGTTRTGREDFSIRGAADGSGPWTLQGTSALETRRLQPALVVDAAGTPVSYQIETRDGRTVAERWTVQIAGQRVVTRVRTASGESSDEFPAPAGAVLADDDIAHHLWLVVRSGARALRVIRPREGSTGTWEVPEPVAEPLLVGGRTVPTRRWTLRADWPGGDRVVWTDAAGRLVQVAVPSADVRYVREELPPR